MGMGWGGVVSVMRFVRNTYPSHFHKKRTTEIENFGLGKIGNQP